MLTCKDIAYKRNEKGDVVQQKTYDRIYFEFGPGDAVEERDKTVGGKSIGKIQVPKDDVSKADPNDLFAAALAYLQDTRKVKQPLLHLLRYFSKGDDLAQRPTFPSDRPVNEDKAIEQAAKKLVELGIASDVASASAIVRDMKAKAQASA